jgi:hypothetical protein
MNDQFYLNEPCVVSFSISEVGWYLQRFQARLRYLKKEEYPDHKFIVFMNPNLHVFINDFVSYTIDWPKELYDLGFDSDCYELVPPNSPAGSLTPPNLYADLIKYMRNFYNKEKAVEIFPPRGCTDYIEYTQQIFVKYTSSETFNFDKPCITVFPRGRVRAAQRNVPAFVWFDLVEKLRQSAIVVLAGTPSGACLADYEAENVINMIKYNESDKTEKIIAYLNSSLCSISSQSGGTHISLLSGCPSYIIGHEQKRHAVNENRIKTPVSFRYVPDYRMIDAETIIKDVNEFIAQLPKKEAKSAEQVLEDDIVTLNKIVEDRNG